MVIDAGSFAASAVCLSPLFQTSPDQDSLQGSQLPGQLNCRLLQMSMLHTQKYKSFFCPATFTLP